MSVKKGAGNTAGDLYQLWLGVDIIKEWIISGRIQDKDNFWIEEELGDDKAGKFDDIGVFIDGVHKFYQVKHTISRVGNLIALADLTDIDKENKLSIDKLFNSFKIIKKIFIKIKASWDYYRKDLKIDDRFVIMHEAI